jgi:hypothetical protein
MMHNKFSDLTPLWESTSQPNLFFAGAAMGGKQFKRYTTAFIHGFRYCIRSQLDIILHREFKTPLRSLKVDNTIEKIATHLVDRVNRCSGPYQMFEVLVDILTLPPLGSTDNPATLDYFLELPRGHVRELDEFKGVPYLEVVLQYGDRGGVPAFLFEQQSVPGKADLGWALHPCFRCYYDGKLIARHHMLETAELNWDIPVYHVEPLKDWLTDLFSLLFRSKTQDLPSVGEEPPLASLTTTYRGTQGEEHLTKMGGQMKDKMMKMY